MKHTLFYLGATLVELYLTIIATSLFQLAIFAVLATLCAIFTLDSFAEQLEARTQEASDDVRRR